MSRRSLALGLAIALVVGIAVAWSPVPLIPSITGVVPVLADVAPETTTTGGADGGGVPLLLIATVATVALIISLGYLSRVDRRREG